MLTISGFKKRCDELKNYPQQLFDMNVARKREYALLGGSEEKFLIIRKACEEVYDDLYVKLKPRGNEMITIPKAFQIPNSFTKELGEKESFKYSFDLWRTSELINLLKEKGTLEKRLGKEESERLYGDFYIWDIRGLQYNPFSILRNCLETIMKTKNNEEELQCLPTISDEQKIRTGHLKKRETAIDWEKRFSYKDVTFLNKKLTSGKTVRDQYIADRMKIVREPIDIVEFKHRMNNLARTIFEDKLTKDPSFSGYEVEYRISERKLLKELTGKEFRDLSTYEKTKTKKMLFAHKNEELTFFEKTADEELKVVYWNLYDYDEYLLPKGSTDIVIKFDLRGQDFRDNKSYIYSDNRDFSIVKQKRDEFWQYIETKEKDDENIIKIGKGLNRVKSNKIFHAAPIKLLNFLKLNFQVKHPLILTKENFNMVCGDIRTEAQSESLSGKKRPALAEAIVKVVRWMVLWIAKEAGWAYTAKVAKGNVIIKPNHKYFTKWKSNKDLLKV